MREPTGAGPYSVVAYLVSSFSGETDAAHTISGLVAYVCLGLQQAILMKSYSDGNSPGWQYEYLIRIALLSLL